MIARIVSDQRPRQFQKWEPVHKWVRSGVKNIEGRVHYKTFEIKQLIAAPKNIQVKKMAKLFEEWQYTAELKSAEY